MITIFILKQNWPNDTMNKKEFEKAVKELAGHDQYIEHSDIIDMIPAQYRDSYLTALGFGHKMDHSFRGLTKAAEISKQLNIPVSEVFRSLSYFLYLNKTLKGNEDVTDPVAEIMDVIDSSKSYEELSFLRDHIQYRIESFLKKTENPNSPAFNKAWHAKRCPACGSTNHFFNTACGTCGWEPE